MPIVSELVTIELVFLLKKIQLHLLVFFIVENSIVTSPKISPDKEPVKLGIPLVKECEELLGQIQGNLGEANK